MRSVFFGIGLVAALGISVGSKLAFAQPNGEVPGGRRQSGPSEPGMLPDVEVRENRQSVEERFQAPGSRVTIRRSDIENMGADTISDVLKQLPGVQSSDSGGIRMRGMDRNATQILVDGERVSGGRRGGQLPFDQLPAEMIERIEIIRSPTAEYSGATGGTINIVLREPLEKRETNLRFSNSHIFDRNAGTAFFARSGPLNAPDPVAKEPSKTDPSKTPDADQPGGTVPMPSAAERKPFYPWTYFLGIVANERVIGNDRIRHTESADGKPLSEDGAESSRTRVREFSMFPRINGRLGPNDSLIFRPFFTANRTTTDTAGSSAGFDSKGAIAANDNEHLTGQRYLLRLRADWTHNFKDSKLETRLATQKWNEDVDRLRTDNATTTLGNSGIRSVYTDKRGEREVSGGMKLTSVSGTHVWLLGGEFENRKLDTSTTTDITALIGPSANITTSTPRIFNSSLMRSVVYAQDEWTVFEKSTFTMGLRLERLNRDSSDGISNFQDNRSIVQPSLNFRQPINSTLQLRANLARTTRLPSLSDVIERVVPSTGTNTVSRPDSIGNPALKPEVALNFDIGVEKRLSPRGQAGLNFFLRDINDLIVRRTTLAGTGIDARWQQRPDNIGGAKVYGIEADWKSDLGWLGQPSWDFNANATVLQSRADQLSGGTTRVPGQPHYMVNIGFAKPIPRVASGGWYGGVTLSLMGASDIGDTGGASGRERAYFGLDAFVGSVIPGLGYWRLGLVNLNNRQISRVRYDVDAITGNQRVERTTDRSDTSIAFTVGWHLGVSLDHRPC